MDRKSLKKNLKWCLHICTVFGLLVCHYSEGFMACWGSFGTFSNNIAKKLPNVRFS